MHALSPSPPSPLSFLFFSLPPTHISFFQMSFSLLFIIKGNLAGKYGNKGWESSVGAIISLMQSFWNSCSGDIVHAYSILLPKFYLAACHTNHTVTQARLSCWLITPHPTYFPWISKKWAESTAWLFIELKNNKACFRQNDKNSCLCQI